MAIEQYEAIYPQVIAAGRGAADRQEGRGLRHEGSHRLATAIRRSISRSTLLGVAWEATEAADTRCWGLLPDRIQVLRVELPAGTHQLALAAVGPYGTGPSGDRHHRRQATAATPTCWPISPTPTLVGKIQTSVTIAARRRNQFTAAGPAGHEWPPARCRAVPWWPR